MASDERKKQRREALVDRECIWFGPAGSADDKADDRRIGAISRNEREKDTGMERFSLVFALSCIGLYALIHFLPPDVTAPLNAHTASTLVLVLNSLGVPFSASNDLVTGPGLAFRIIPECTPVFTAGLFLCFVGCYPAAFREKAKALLLGIPTLYLGNLARLAGIALISRYDRRLFEFVHVYLGQVFTLFLVIAACLAWMRRLNRNPSTRSRSFKSAVFLARFAVISGCLFLVWIKFHHGYIRLLDRFILLGFSLFNHQVPLARNTVYYYETFSTVVLTSLVLADGSMPLKRRLKGLAGGLGVLFVTHLIHRINNVLLAYFQISSVVSIDLTLLVVGQYLVPVLFLIYLLPAQRALTPGMVNDGEKPILGGRLPLKNAALGVCIDKQDFSLFFEDRTGEIDGNGGLADSSLLIDQADDHDQPRLVNKRPESLP